MCGIAGVLGKEGHDQVSGMVASLRHRGPDDSYVLEGSDFCLGAARLSIIDVEGGRQPVANEGDSIFLAHNGEVYNFAELEQKYLSSHHMKSRCDTEVLVHLYEEFGTEFVRYLKGMFAAAIWDGEKRRGVLVRDRVGKKPLYYMKRGDSLFFASEIKGLLRVAGKDRRINKEALHYYLSYKHVPCPLSIFEGIYQLPPAHLLLFEPHSEPRIQRYWKPSFASASTSVLGEEGIADTLLNLLKQAVNRRLVSDVPIGFILSGGLDSSLITALAAGLSREPIKTFSLVYPPGEETEGKKLDRLNAKRISEMYGTEHHEEVLEFSGYKEALPGIIRHFDEPFAGVVSEYFISRLISKHVKVALSGDGSDELFGSYLSHRLAFPIAQYVSAQHSPSSSELFEGRIDLGQVAARDEWVWRYKFLVFPDEEKLQGLYSESTTRELATLSTLDHLKGYYANLSAQDPLNRVLEAEFGSFLPDQVLAYVDRLSMAHSLEVRCPYLDSDFVEFAASIPGALKIRDSETKYILKKASLGYVPKEIAYRKKEGFILPLNKWLVEDLEDYVYSTLSAESLQSHGLFNADYVRSLIDRFYAGDESLANKILALLNFQVWYEGYMVE